MNNTTAPQAAQAAQAATVDKADRIVYCRMSTADVDEAKQFAAEESRTMAQCRSVKSERHFFDGILGLGHTNLTRIPPVGSARRQHEAADVLSHGRKLGRDGPRGV